MMLFNPASVTMDGTCNEPAIAEYPLLWHTTLSQDESMLIKGPLGTIPPPQTCKPRKVELTVLCIVGKVLPSVELVLLPFGKEAI